MVILVLSTVPIQAANAMKSAFAAPVLNGYDRYYGMYDAAKANHTEPTAALDTYTAFAPYSYGITINKFGGSCRFTQTLVDVMDGTWYADAVTWEAASSIVSGVGNDQFAPGSNLTREQMSVILWGYAEHMDLTLTQIRTGAFVDESQISVWALQGCGRYVRGRSNKRKRRLGL